MVQCRAEVFACEVLSGEALPTHGYGEGLHLLRADTEHGRDSPSTTGSELHEDELLRKSVSYQLSYPGPDLPGQFHNPILLAWPMSGLGAEM